MNRHQFTNNPNVISFVDWMAPRLGSLPVNLAIPVHRRFVPGGVTVAALGVDAVTAAYKWRGSGMTVGDWQETTAHCAALANALRTAVASEDHAAALQAAWAIILWGGGNQTIGAYPFLLSLGKNLIPYLISTERAFRLESTDTEKIVPPVKKMNSMLTKVHAFLATDGLPIYDARVAAAIATLVEAWRQATLAPNALGSPIPNVLHFPTVNGRAPSRTTVMRKFANAKKPLHLAHYNTSSAFRWAEAKIRLGWLMEKLLEAQPAVFTSTRLPVDKMRALEAALFMIGYDVSCL